MFIRVKEWTVNTSQITFIYHHPDGGIEIYFVNGKRMDVDARHAKSFLDILAKNELINRKENKSSAQAYAK